MNEEYFEKDEPIAIEIDGILDLHHFAPKDIKTLIPEYLNECQIKRIMEVKIIHGKGTGNLRRSVHALLERNPMVHGFRLAELDSGSWGATIVSLKM